MQILLNSGMMILLILVQPAIKKPLIYFPSLFVSLVYFIRSAQNTTSPSENKFSIVLPIFLMSNILQFEPFNTICRNLIFYPLFFTTILLEGMFGGLYLKFFPNSAGIAMETFAKSILFLCSSILNLSVEIDDQENPLKGLKGSLIAPQHQSHLESIALAAYVPNAKFMFADSFLKVPGLGFFLQKLNMMPVNRNPNKTIRQTINLVLTEKAKTLLEQNNNIIIFPEGTRRPFGSPGKLKSGIFYIAKAARKEIIPAWTNTGLFWPKKDWIIKPGKALIKFGKAIPPDKETLQHAFDKPTAPPITSIKHSNRDPAKTRETYIKTFSPKTKE